MVCSIVNVSIVNVTIAVHMKWALVAFETQKADENITLPFGGQWTTLTFNRNDAWTIFYSSA